MTAPRVVDVIGVPFNSAGSNSGVARAPAALRAAGLIDAIKRAGIDVTDRGDLRVEATTAGRDPASHVIAPESLGSMIRGVGSRVAESLERGAFPIVIGGDCPILLGCLAGFATPRSSVGLVFVDGHEDAWPPDQSPSGEAADMELGFALGLTIGDLPRDLQVRISSAGLRGGRRPGATRSGGTPGGGRRHPRGTARISRIHRGRQGSSSCRRRRRRTDGRVRPVVVPCRSGRPRDGKPLGSRLSTAGGPRLERSWPALRGCTWRSRRCWLGHHDLQPRSRS